MTSALPSRQTLTQLAGVALLACGNVATVYGGWQLREAFGLKLGHPLLNALPPFLLLCLPLVLLYAVFEARGYKLSRLVGLPVRAGDSPLISTVAFGVLGAGWVFVRGGLADRALMKEEAKLAKPSAAHPPHNPGPGREAAETVVFVVVLVLMLKLFVVEAFVIPTGSMAETLYGYKKTIECDECHFVFPLNASDEADPPPGRVKQKVIGYCCPNCRYEGATAAKDKEWGSGDRVLVGKFFGVQRGDVVVFKYPEAPQTNQTAQNYIKRLVGMPGETVAVYRGDLYVTDALAYPPDTDVKPMDLWMKANTYPGSRMAEQKFAESRAEGFTNPGGFRIVRKPDDLVMAMRRIVYDNDHQSDQLARAGHQPRWQVGGGWQADSPTQPRAFTHSGGELDWVRYQHLMPPHERMQDPRTYRDHQPAPYHRPGWVLPANEVTLKPRKITNFMGYNSGFPENARAVPPEGAEKGAAQREAEQIRNGEKPEAARQWNREYQDHLADSDLWVGDLMVECTATVGDGGAVVLQLSKGDHSYRAEFDGGNVRLKVLPNDDTRPDGNKTTRPRTVAVGDDTFTLASTPSGVKAGTAHRLRFANVDCRLRVWVDDRPIDFGGKGDYTPPKGADKETAADGSTLADVDWPAAVGASGTASVSGLKLWRDTLYANYTGGQLDTYYVQPGHYLCMGDNSSQSSDGRAWGLVPERLMLGRAVFTFFPVDRLGFIK